MLAAVVRIKPVSNNVNKSLMFRLSPVFGPGFGLLVLPPGFELSGLVGLFELSAV